MGNPQPFHEFGWSTHDVQVDEAGIAWVVGGNGTIAFDVNPDAYPVSGKEDAAALLEPTMVARTGPNATGDSDFDTIPGSTEERRHGERLHPPQLVASGRRRSSSPAKRGSCDTTVRPGELVLITEEDIWNRVTSSTPGGCESQGSFQTWQVKQLRATGPDQGTVENLDSWTTSSTRQSRATRTHSPATT